MRFPTLFALAIFAVCFQSAANAADIRRSEHPLYGFILEGEIIPGDYDKLRKLIEEDCPGNYFSSSCASDLFLSSPGGSVSEAIRIGRLVRSLRWKTEAPITFSEEYRAARLADARELPGVLRTDLEKRWRQTFESAERAYASKITALKLKDPKANYLCASACFFIFVAGIDRSSVVESDKALLAVHRPFMTDADLRSLSANQVMKATTQVRGVIESYLKEMSVPAKYAELMFSISKDQVRWITEAEYKSDFGGLIPELRDWVKARCDKRSDADRRLEELLEEKRMIGQLSPADDKIRIQLIEKFELPQIDCEIGLMNQMRNEAKKAYRPL